MSESWHNFVFGGSTPPPRRRSTNRPWTCVERRRVHRVGGPAAAAGDRGTLSVALLYDLVRRVYGGWAGAAAGMTLAVLPAAGLTSRSDTMDSVMAMLLVLAAGFIIRARPQRREGAVVAAFAVAGLAFEVKLFEAGVALPGLALLAWLALEAPWRRRLGVLALGGVGFLVVASAWGVVASLLPGTHPFPYGSTRGTIWD